MLGAAISVAEADVASQFYRDAVRQLNDLLRQIAATGKATEDDWKEIQGQIREIQKMERPSWMAVAEFFSYGQGSSVEQQGYQYALLAGRLAEKFGFERKRTWGDFFSGKLGKYQPKKE